MHSNILHLYIVVYSKPLTKTLASIQQEFRKRCSTNYVIESKHVHHYTWEYIQWNTLAV